MAKIRCPICNGTGKSGRMIPLRTGGSTPLPCSWCNKGMIDDWDEKRILKINKMDSDQTDMLSELYATITAT